MPTRTIKRSWLSRHADKQSWLTVLRLLLLCTTVSWSISCASMKPAAGDHPPLPQAVEGTADELNLLANFRCESWRLREEDEPGTAPLLREWLGRIYLQHHIDAVTKMREEPDHGYEE